MKRAESSGEIDRVAADWVVREDARPLTADEAAALAAWLGDDPRRHGAYLRAQAAWVALDRGKALPPAALEASRPALRIPRRAMVAGAAGLAAALGGGWWWLEDQRHDRYATAVGEIRQVPLRDGSSATINTASRIDVVMEQERRLVRLTEGEAWFEVAKDKTRPFLVEAGDVTVRAVGTAFSVRRYDWGADVIVTEGVVEISRDGADGPPERVAAGAHVFVGADGVSGQRVLPVDDMKRVLAWRQGLIGLNGETVRDAAAQFNRFNVRQIVIEDEDLADERVVGFFRATDPEAFTRAVVKSFHARVWIDEDTLRLTRSGAG